MDNNNRRRGHNEAPYQGQDPRFNTDQSQGRNYPTSSAERYRPAPITTSPDRGVGGASSYSGYYQEGAPSSFTGSLPQSTMQYQGGYPQDQRQQTFNTYSPEINMYGVAPQPQQSNVYDSASQYPARQPAAMQMLSDTAPYFANESATAAGPPVIQQHASSTSSIYQQQGSPNSRSSLVPQNYNTNLAMGGMSQSAPDLLPEDEFQPEGPGMEAAYTSYQTALKEIFQNILNGRLSEASQSLLNVSEWLLGHVQDLGLIVDEVALHGDRIRLWGEFNNAWLGIFQKQKDMLESGLRVSPPQSLMSQEFINRMVRDLIRLCDGIESHGLVDYQYGVAEERIIMIVEECLDLQESLEGGAPP